MKDSYFGFGSPQQQADMHARSKTLTFFSGLRMEQVGGQYANVSYWLGIHLKTTRFNDSESTFFWETLYTVHFQI